MPVTEKNIATSVNWIDVLDPTVSEMEELSARYQLNQHTVRDCMQPEHLPKYEYDEEGDIHFLILRFYAHNVDKSAATIQELTDKIAIFGNENMLITIHKSATPFLDVLARRYHSPKTFTTAELLSKIVWQALETYDEPANRLSEQIDFYENKVLLNKASTSYTEALYYIKRQANATHKVLMLMVEPINHINVSSGDAAHLQDVRDQHLKMQTLYAQILDESNNLLNLSTSFASQRTNDVMRVLTVFSAFFLPVTFVAGIYGMNFEFMPELKKQWGYPGVLLLMGAIILTIFTWFKRKKWI